ncbi:MAG: hypothetical protein A2Y38_07705 [Spirochaetes bacterium GWB1_59_5]|nr:MAG: hypothetical protein A2Y38_07705 [Spirochaetes bacterium GWB1_59_5]
MEGIRTRLRKHLDTGVSQTAVARAIAKSSTAVSLFLGDKYNGDNEALAELLDGYLTKVAERELVPQEPIWQETVMARGLLDVFHTAGIRRKIVTVVGAPGLGKTMTIQAYAERHPETIVVTAHEGIRGAKGLVSHLLAVSRVRAQGGRTLDSQLAAIVTGLRDSGRLIIVDDCQTLHPRSLECLRYIHDTARVGLALCGNWTTHPLLTQQGAGQFAQLFSRISCIHYMDDKWHRDDVALVVRSACPTLDDEQVGFFHAILGAPLCDMRTVRDVLFEAMEIAQKLKAGRVTMAHLRKAAEMNDRAAQLRSHLPPRRTR